MKKIFKFSKFYILTTVFYAALLIGGFVLIFTKGINRGVDFQAGLVAQVRFAPAVLSLSYDGNDKVSLSQDVKGLHIVTTSMTSESKTDSFLYSEYKTVADFLTAANNLAGLKAISLGQDNVSLSSLFASGTESTQITQKPLKLHSLETTSEPLTSDSIRQSLSSIPGVTVQQAGEANLRTFQIRLADTDDAKNTSDNLKKVLSSALNENYGADNYAFLTADFMGSQFSATLLKQSVVLLLASLLLIFLYVMVRFKWDFSLAATAALIFDSYTMILYMVITRIELSSFTVAALLTIVGYSVNDTVVMFDRVRENTRLFPDMLGTDIIDKSVSEVLGRSIITSITTIVAVLILFLFTEGSTRDFAEVLLVGLISGVITTIFLSSAVLNWTCGTKKGQEIIKSQAQVAKS